jgi:inorganic phosphate transporter, PiT family
VNLTRREQRVYASIPAADLIARYGDDQKAVGVAAARKLADTFAAVKSAEDIPEAERPAVRNDLDQVLSEFENGFGSDLLS